MKRVMLTLLLLITLACSHPDYDNQFRPIKAAVDEIAMYELGVPITYGELIDKAHDGKVSVESTVRTIRSTKSPYRQAQTDSINAYLATTIEFFTRFEESKKSQATASYLLSLTAYTNEQAQIQRDAAEESRDKFAELQTVANRYLNLIAHLQTFMSKDIFPQDKLLLEYSKIKV